ncbi:MAG: hypothetical protein H0X51_06300 [Parachlamydiaceae bacterium]|nr:hypothetical protein [Parachlamydiaceae bacterium]
MRCCNCTRKEYFFFEGSELKSKELNRVEQLLRKIFGFYRNTHFNRVLNNAYHITLNPEAQLSEQTKTNLLRLFAKTHVPNAALFPALRKYVPIGSLKVKNKDYPVSVFYNMTSGDQPRIEQIFFKVIFNHNEAYEFSIRKQQYGKEQSELRVALPVLFPVEHIPYEAYPTSREVLAKTFRSKDFYAQRDPEKANLFLDVINKILADSYVAPETQELEADDTLKIINGSTDYYKPTTSIVFSPVDFLEYPDAKDDNDPTAKRNNAKQDLQFLMKDWSCLEGNSEKGLRHRRYTRNARRESDLHDLPTGVSLSMNFAFEHLLQHPCN